MKIEIENFYGKTTKFDLQLYKLKLNLENSTELEALENGWLIHNNEWYQSRSVRINLDKYNKVPKQIKDHKFIFSESINKNEIDKVFNEFLIKKNLESNYNLYDDIERSLWLFVYKENDLVAFSKFIKYENGLESQYTAWDYKEPKLSIGSKIVDHEVEYAKSLGLNHLYIGSGYENISKYKSNFKGFEYWTGSEWSCDIEKYIKLCERDTLINTIEELNNNVYVIK